MSESKSGLYETRDSIYCYKGSNVLINKLNIHDNKILKQAEEKIVAAKLFILRQNTMIAGKFRTENIAKGFFSFAEWEFIEDELSNLLKKLNESNNLKNLKRDEFVKAIAYYLSELNVLHPFREGNGRTIREFIRELCYVNDYLFDLQKIEPKDFLNACIKSVVDTSELEKLIDESLVKIQTK